METPMFGGGVASGEVNNLRSGAALPRRQGQPEVHGECSDQLQVADSANVHTATGMAYAAIVIDVFARKTVGWRVSISMTTSFVLDALDRAICRRHSALSGRIHRSDRGMQRLAIRYTERRAKASIDMSTRSVGDSYDNSLAKSVIGLSKIEVAKHLDPWKMAAKSNGKP